MGAQFGIGFASLGNGLSVYNRAKEERGNYQKVAHIDRQRKITWYLTQLPDVIREQIIKVAKGPNMAASQSQPDKLVFNNA
ncbi:MAG: hypothetical protein ABIJ40_00090 [Bacteroidota bacterium]